MKMLLNFFINNDLKYLIPEFFYFIIILILLLLFVFYSNYNIYKYIKVIKPLISLILINFIIYILLVINSINYNNSISYHLLLNDNLIIFLKIFIILFSSFLILVSYDYLKSYNILLFEFYILIFISIFSMLIIIMSYDFIITYLSIELQSLCFYILSSINKNQNKSVEAGIKYFILGSFSSSLLLFGISIIYGITGMSNFKDLSDIFEIGFQDKTIDNFFSLGIILINLGIFFKLSIAPFHLWLPDIFDGSIKIIMAFFATIPKFSLLFLFLKIYNIILVKVLIDWQFFFIFFIFLSWIIGIFGALKVKKINKLMAYSSINHIGFIILALILNNIEGLLLYLFIYLFISLNIFTILFLLVKYNNNNKINFINQLIYLKKNNYILNLSFTVALFSLAGIPPLSGFFGKFFIFLNALNLNLNLLVLFGLILSTISCFYYLKIIKLINFNNFKIWYFLYPISKSASYIVSFCLIFNIVFFLFLPFLLEFFKYISLSLYIL